MGSTEAIETLRSRRTGALNREFVGLLIRRLISPDNPPIRIRLRNPVSRHFPSYLRMSVMVSLLADVGA